MFWLRMMQWVLWAHLILIGALTLGALVALAMWGVAFVAVRGAM